MAEKKSSRKGKPKKTKGGEEPAPARHELPGLAILAVVLVSLIGLVSELASRTGNILGPYFGEWWANALIHAAGTLPILFYLVALSVLGIQIVMAKRWWRQIAIIAAMGFFIALLLGIKFMGTPPASLDYSSAGGWIGNFVIQTIFLPVFGPAHFFGPYLITAILLFFVIVWGYRLSVAAMLSRTANVAGTMGRSIAEGWRNSREEDGDEEEFEDDEEEWEPAIPVAAKVARKREEKKDDRILPNEGDSPEEEKAKLEALLESGNLEGLDPLTIRKIRDLALERKRVTELNDWETKNRSPEIGGLLGKSENSEAEKAKRIAKPEPEKLLPAVEETEDPVMEFEEEVRSGDPSPAAPKKKPARKRESLPGPEAVSLALEVSGEAGADLEKSAAPTVKYDVYQLPEVDAIFPDSPQQALEFTEEELHEQSKLLEDQLNNFKVRGKVSGIHPGPVITRYEVELAPGEKVNRINNLADDLALALRAKSIRILAPIPGKSLVGIEVPNKKAQIVYIKEILTSQDFLREEDTLKIAVGKTIAGDPYVADLTRAPHLLIAGQTGSGKSVCINSIMASLLSSKTPDELRMILIDPKVVELKPYDAIPHLLRPVVTQPEVAVLALKWATVKMDERYEVLAQCGVRNIKGFNQKVREGTLPEGVQYNQFLEFGDGAGSAAAVRAPTTTMPYILIVIDELADLMMVAGKEVETNIARIAQKARAVGIHLILATQRPSTNVITGTIKANLPTRMAFQVASQIDARTILDRQGAEKLLGRGDMLYRPIEFPEPVRLHGCYIDDDQCEKIADACSNQHVNYPQVKTFNIDEDADSARDMDEERDDRFREAAELVVQLKQASVSLLQRRMGLGYARSGRLVDQLERAGIVGRERGSKPREVLMQEEELRSFLSSHDATENA